MNAAVRTFQETVDMIDQNMKSVPEWDIYAKKAVDKPSEKVVTSIAKDTVIKPILGLEQQRGLYGSKDGSTAKKRPWNEEQICYNCGGKGHRMAKCVWTKCGKCGSNFATAEMRLKHGRNACFKDLMKLLSTESEPKKGKTVVEEKEVKSPKPTSRKSWSAERLKELNDRQQLMRDTIPVFHVDHDIATMTLGTPLGSNLGNPSSWESSHDSDSSGEENHRQSKSRDGSSL
jgi:predicted  nucleic acid-binding Zn-ribbon protein